MDRPTVPSRTDRRTLLGAALALPAAVLSPVPGAAAAQREGSRGLPMARPEEVGFSSERLERIRGVVQRTIDAGQLAGGVTLVARRGKVVHYEAYGQMDLESKQPMRRDAIFRMASSTKPVTGVAVMQLVEEGRVRLSDSLSRFLPEFRQMKVAVAELGSTEVRLVPAQREITIRDLLTHTSGLASGGPGAAEAARVLRTKQPTDTLADFLPRLAAVPLDFQPGTLWRYSGLAGIDLLGRVVEVVSGLTFDQYLKRLVFEPLGMQDTFFSPPDDRQSRVATLYRRTPNGLERTDPPAVLSGKAYFSGAGGLLSTAADYFRFAQMLANGGQLGGKRLLAPSTVRLMGSNHVGTTFIGQLGRPEGMGFGLTMEVVVDGIKADTRRSNGSFGWDGAFGTHFWVDQKEQLAAVLMIQTASRQLHRDYENAVMQALVD